MTITDMTITEQNPESRSIKAGMERPGNKRNLSRSATRALDILEYFAMVGRPLRTVEISQALDIGTSSIDQLLKTMVDSAYLQFDPSNKLYYPSPRLVNFGSWLSDNYFGEDRICRLMRSIQDETGETITLSIRHGAFMQIVDVYAPPARAGTIPKGLRVPIIDTVIGSAFLAAHNDKEVIRIVDQITAATHSKVSPDELRDLLARVQSIRSKGYASGPAIAADGPWALSIALPKPTVGAVIVLGLAGDRNSVTEKEVELVELMTKKINYFLEKNTP
jgi:DNA-binding IclR family transcriptional regulator